MPQLWQGRASKAVDSRVNDFNSSIRFDARMIEQDIQGSLVHSAMLGRQGIISRQDVDDIHKGLHSILDDLHSGALEIDPNASLVKDIILKMTTDEDIMKEIVVADDDFVNNKPAMEAMAADTSYQSKVLGGQNPLAMFCAGAEKIDLSNLSAYDQGCNEEFQHAMKNYFDGKASLDDALNLFYKAVEEKYPELTH